MTIKNIFKGKKNLFVFEMLGEADKVYFKIHESNVKLQQFDTKRYPLQARQDYLKEKHLKPVTYAEFETALMQEAKKVVNKSNTLLEKFRKATDELANPEFRHFIYECKLGNTPLLTEGVVKAVQYAKEIDRIAGTWNKFVTELESLIGAFFEETTPYVELTDDYFEFYEILKSKNFCSGIVKKHKFEFDETVFDELPLDEEEAENTDVETTMTTVETETNGSANFTDDVVKAEGSTSEGKQM